MTSVRLGTWPSLEIIPAVPSQESDVILVHCRMLGARPSHPPFVCLDSSAADRDRRGAGDGDAPGVLPLHAGRLETGDSANVR